MEEEDGREMGGSGAVRGQVAELGNVVQVVSGRGSERQRKWRIEAEVRRRRAGKRRTRTIL